MLAPDLLLSVLTLVSAPTFASPVPPQGWTVAAPESLSAGDPGDFAYFGEATAVRGQTAVVAAYGDSHSGLDSAGAVYVFEEDQGGPGAWGQVAKLVASDAADRDYFGSAVALDGDTLVVGAYLADPGGLVDSGAVYVFERSAGSWGEVAKLTAPGGAAGDLFGSDVAIHGYTIVIGAERHDPGEQTDAGAAYVFERQGQGLWQPAALLVPGSLAPDDGFGSSVAVRGSTLLVGAPRQNEGDIFDAGAVYVYERGPGSGGAWNESTRLVAGDATDGALYGVSVALHGDTAAIGAEAADSPSNPKTGAVYVHERNAGGAGAFAQVRKLLAGDEQSDASFGNAVALDLNTILVGARNLDTPAGFDVGRAYLFERNESGPGAWGQVAALLHPAEQQADRFGTSVALDAHHSLVGTPTLDAGFDPIEVRALAWEPSTGTLYGAAITDRQLVVVDLASGGTTPIGSTGFVRVLGLAFDPATGTLYGCDETTDQLLVIDPTTGGATAIGPLGFSRVQGLDFDPFSGVLFGTHRAAQGAGQLITIDTATGAGTAVGPIGFDEVEALAFDPATGVLHAASRTQGVPQLITIDPATGAGTLVGNLTPAAVLGLAFGSAGTLHGSTQWMPGGALLVDVDPATGAGNTVGSLSTQIVAMGRSYLFDVSYPGVSYCTAGVSASGCAATLSASGTPSASAGFGFQLTASWVEGAKDGQFFYGVNGAQASAWGNGTSFQCVVPPVVRAGIKPGVGTPGLCDGQFSQDLNQLWAQKPGKNPGAGAFVRAQLWYRDPASTSSQTTSLSDGHEFYVTE